MSGPRVRGASVRYNWAHRKTRERLLAELARNQPQPCRQRWADGRICGAPMTTDMRLDLGHLDDGTVALVHRWCNRNAAQQKQVILEKAKRQPPSQPPPQRGPVSRPW